MSGGEPLTFTGIPEGCSCGWGHHCVPSPCWGPTQFLCLFKQVCFSQLHAFLLLGKTWKRLEGCTRSGRLLTLLALSVFRYLTQVLVAHFIIRARSCALRMWSIKGKCPKCPLVYDFHTCSSNFHSVLMMPESLILQTQIQFSAAAS